MLFGLLGGLFLLGIVGFVGGFLCFVGDFFQFVAGFLKCLGGFLKFFARLLFITRLGGLGSFVGILRCVIEVFLGVG